MMKRQPPADSTFFVGDIQGCARPLGRLLRAARFNPDKHHLIALGDTINRGPDNVGTLSLLRGLGAEPILGNHELAILGGLSTGKAPAWLLEQSVSRDLLKHPKCASYLDWIAGWPHWIWGHGWLAVHGGLHPRLPIEETDPLFLATIRLCDSKGRKPKGWDGSSNVYPQGFKPWHHYYRGDDLVLYGHWARQGLRVGPRTVGLDSGCVYGGGLSGMWYPSREIVQVSS
ncbi:MAG: hypothetical protein HOK28_04945 [Deltaproteobacteria bacterium]|nr:hypothetical protein [Deltaproteobacteria bacterium]